MEYKKILKFIEDNKGELLMDFYNKTYDKLKSINRRAERLTLYLVVISFLYFIAKTATISSIQIGPVSINDTDILLKLIPVLFAYLLLEFSLIIDHKMEIFGTIKLIFLILYKQEIKENEVLTIRNNFFTRLIIPFSYMAEFGKIIPNKATAFIGCLGQILFLPLILLFVLPFYFEYYMIKQVYQNYLNDFLGKASFYLSIWIFVIVIFLFINSFFLELKYMKLNNKENSEK